MRNPGTVDYFEKNTPEYSVGRIAHAVKAINRLCSESASLVDIGCGTGNILDFIKNETPLQSVCGIDVSPNCLAKTKERVGCETFLGSILDSDFVETLGARYDFGILAAVLHHLVGRTREESKRLALSAIRNSLTLLNDGGYLFIIEPVFYPPFIMDLVFSVKEFVTMLTSMRVEILDKWNNIGAPLVSYYTIEQLIRMIRRIGHCEILEIDIEERNLTTLFRLALIRRRSDVTIILKKTGHFSSSPRFGCAGLMR
jgi:SAM-dependent methyltransferase